MVEGDKFIWLSTPFRAIYECEVIRVWGNETTFTIQLNGYITGVNYGTHAMTLHQYYDAIESGNIRLIPRNPLEIKRYIRKLCLN